MTGLVTLGHIAVEAGVPFKTLDGWVRLGHVKVTAIVGGRGTRMFDVQARYACVVAAHLRRRGAADLAVMLAARFLSFRSREDLEGHIARGEVYLVTALSNDQVFLASKETIFTTQRDPTHVAFIIANLGHSWEAFLAQARIGGTTAQPEEREEVYVET